MIKSLIHEIFRIVLPHISIFMMLSYSSKKKTESQTMHQVIEIPSYLNFSSIKLSSQLCQKIKTKREKKIFEILNTFVVNYEDKIFLFSLLWCSLPFHPDEYLHIIHLSREEECSVLLQFMKYSNSSYLTLVPA